MNEIKKVDRRTSTEKHRKNPFRAETVAEVSIGQKNVYFGTGTHLVNDDTGEVEAEAAYKQVRYVDKSKFLMVYQAMQSLFWQLSPRAQKVLRVVFTEVSYRAINKDEIYMNWDVAKEVFDAEGIKMSRATYFRGLSELIEKKVLAESVKTNIFFINPVLIFNGSRASFVQQIVLDDPSIAEEAQEITARRALEASRELDGQTLKQLGDSLKEDKNK